MKNTEETLKLLNHIQEKPDSTQRELVGELNISLGKVNFLISALASKGLVKLKRFKSSKKKKGYMYILTPKGMKSKTELTKHFLKSKTEEYERLKKEIEEYTAILAGNKGPENIGSSGLIPRLKVGALDPSNMENSDDDR